MSGAVPSSFPTPALGKDIDYAHVYEPAEDTFLMLDALEADLEYIRAIKPNVILEVGSGSGCCITFLAQITGCACPVAIDINPEAIKATRSTALANGITAEAIRGSLLDGIRPGVLDVLLFNPPYVPTEEQPGLHMTGIEASWAGGLDGRYWIDLLLPLVPRALSPNGAFYMVVVEENRPAELADIARSLGLSCAVVKSRRARNEHLHILRFTRT